MWIIDPIDGTTNFINGVPRFAVMVALVQRCETVMGWIHDPLTGKTVAAEKGAGAWQTHSGRRNFVRSGCRRPRTASRK